jgi:hypothetical protein
MEVFSFKFEAGKGAAREDTRPTVGVGLKLESSNLGLSDGS